MEVAVRALYQKFLDGWNQRNGALMAASFAADGEQIGFDGSLVPASAIAETMDQIFAHHQTAAYVAKVQSVRLLGEEAAVLRAIAGMVPPGPRTINPAVNSHHTVVAERRDGEWRVVLFQNTPAQFHGRPELVAQMTAELQELV